MKEFVSITLDKNQWRLIASYLVEQRIVLKDSKSPEAWIDSLKEVIDEINRKLEPKELEGYSFEVGV